MPIQSLEDLLPEEIENSKKIMPSEPVQGEEVSTFIQFEHDVTGEVTTLDKKIPRLNLGQKSGALGESKGFGNLILNKEMVLAPFGKTITATAIKIRKQYQERRPYDPASTTLPRMFNTVKEAREAGFSTEWGDEKIALPIAHILWFIPAPEGLDQEEIDQNFFYDFKGVRYSAALFTTSPTGYNATAKPIFTALDSPKVREKGGLRSIIWKLTSDRQQNAKNSWFNLKIVASGFNQPDLMNYTKEVLP